MFGNLVEQQQFIHIKCKQDDNQVKKGNDKKEKTFGAHQENLAKSVEEVRKDFKKCFNVKLAKSWTRSSECSSAHKNASPRGFPVQW